MAPIGGGINTDKINPNSSLTADNYDKRSKNRGILYDLMGEVFRNILKCRYEKARIFCETALKMDPLNSSMATYYRLILEKLKDKNSAEKTANDSSSSKSSDESDSSTEGSSTTTITTDSSSRKVPSDRGRRSTTYDTSTFSSCSTGSSNVTSEDESSSNISSSLSNKEKEFSGKNTHEDRRTSLKDNTGSVHSTREHNPIKNVRTYYFDTSYKISDGTECTNQSEDLKNSDGSTKALKAPVGSDRASRKIFEEEGDTLTCVSAISNQYFDRITEENSNDLFSTEEQTKKDLEEMSLTTKVEPQSDRADKEINIFKEEGQ